MPSDFAGRATSLNSVHFCRNFSAETQSKMAKQYTGRGELLQSKKGGGEEDLILNSMIKRIVTIEKVYIFQWFR